MIPPFQSFDITVQWSLYFKTTNTTMKMWSYTADGLKGPVMNKIALWDQISFLIIMVVLRYRVVKQRDHCSYVQWNLSLKTTVQSMHRAEQHCGPTVWTFTHNRNTVSSSIPFMLKWNRVRGIRQSGPSIFSSALCYCTAELLSSRGRPSVVRPSVRRHRFLGNRQVDLHKILLTGTYPPYLQTIFLFFKILNF